MNPNFSFLEDEYPRLAGFASLAEQSLFIGPASSLVKLRLAFGFRTKTRIRLFVPLQFQ